MPKDIKLSRLDDVLQVAMGWEGDHLHQYWASDRRTCYGSRDPDFGMDEYDNTIDESKVKLDEVLRRPKQKMIYEYDFGDGWEHDVVLEKTLPREPGAKYPTCATGQLACPPEDCGGVWGYYNLLDAQADPKHEMHGELLDWLGGEPFDPERFDLSGVNKVLHQLARAR